MKKIENIALSILVALFAVTMVANAAESATPDRDNSQVNARVENNAELTAQDQGNSDGDIALTRKIRQSVVKQKGLSTDAKNVKIISLNGRVTLKGPVKSTREKATIVHLAKNVAGKAKVVDQIEVETK